MKNEDIVKRIKSQRVRWFRHIWRRREEENIRRVVNWKPPVTRARGRPRERWEAQVRDDLRRMGIRNWNVQIANRTAWKKIVMETTIHAKL